MIIHALSSNQLTHPSHQRVYQTAGLFLLDYDPRMFPQRS